MDLNIGGGAYSVEAPIAVQTCINLFPEVEKRGSQSAIVLRRFPGLTLFSDLGGPIRGLKRMSGILYAVAGTSLFSVADSGVSTNLGTIPGTGVVSMATDGTSMVIINGSITSYVYSTSIAEVELPYQSSKVLYLDTFFVHQRPSTNQFFISSSGSATTYSALDIASKEGQHGEIVSIFVNHRNLVLQGEDTTETWRNTGNADFPFQRQEGTFLERGSVGRFAAAALDNTMYFLGDDLVIYALRGYQPIRISHHAIENWLSKQAASVLAAATGMTITYAGHYWYVLSFSTGTWVYDATVSGMLESPEWFQLKSSDRDNWRVEAIETAYGMTICGDQAGNLYKLDPTAMTENGQMQIKERTTSYYHTERNPVSCPRIELGVNQGVGNASEANPMCRLEISKDWGKTWSSRRERSLGRAGEYNKTLVWRRNGYGRTFVFRFIVTDPVDVIFTGAYGTFSSGTG